jgi:hypothetical protein
MHPALGGPLCSGATPCGMRALPILAAVSVVSTTATTAITAETAG